MQTISARSLKPMLTGDAEIAFLDVREHGQYGEGHPFFAVHLPYSQLEALAPRLIPRRAVTTVLMDDGDGVAVRAARGLERLGYRDVRVLEDGVKGWAAAGFGLLKGVNVPSKAFGELTEHRLGTPSVSADELHAMQEEGANLLVLDGRPGSEFHKMSLPGARSCPNAELGYRLATLSADPETTVVVNCAGRTRSIIGAQTLAMLGVPNPVFALRNGTQGWRLAGYELAYQRDVEPLPVPGAEALDEGRQAAARLRERYGIPAIDGARLDAWRLDEGRTTYLFDVRTRPEFEAGHVLGACHAAGGQLVQATDQYLAVRGARIVLSCDTGLRSSTTAIWLAGMGHDVHVLGPGSAGMDARTEQDETWFANTMEPSDIGSAIRGGARVLDVSRGVDFRNGHIAGAVWMTRARLDFAALSDPARWIVVGDDAVLIDGVVRDITQRFDTAPMGVVRGDGDIWREAGLSVESTPDNPPDEACIDFLFFVHDRHDGNLDAARRYLEWELGLLDQLDAQERGVLDPLQPRSDGMAMRHAS